MLIPGAIVAAKNAMELAGAIWGPILTGYRRPAPSRPGRWRLTRPGMVRTARRRALTRSGRQRAAGVMVARSRAPQALAGSARGGAAGGDELASPVQLDLRSV